MLKKIINKYILETIKSDEVAILFSGGMDSLSLLLSCLSVGLKPKLYTFTLDNYESEDMKKSKEISKIYDLDLIEVKINTTKINLITDIEYIINLFDVKRKTQIQCIHPFLYVIPKIKESVILSGLCADDLYGSSRSMFKISKDDKQFYNKRCELYNNIQSSSYVFIKKIAEMNDKVFIAPYKECDEIASYMLSKNYKELNSPKQKNVMYESYKEDLDKYKLYRRNSNLQCNSKIREWHDELLLNKKVNKNNYKSVVGVYNQIYKEVKNKES